MKRFALFFALLSTSVLGFAKEKGGNLAEPFAKMDAKEAKETGLSKLNKNEQKALAKWLNNNPLTDTADKEISEPTSAAKEVSITQILENGKSMVFSDGTALKFDDKTQKKIKTWQVGDKIGLGTPGRRGAVNLYHIATGIKIKAFREQAPKATATTSQNQ